MRKWMLIMTLSIVGSAGALAWAVSSSTQPAVTSPAWELSIKFQDPQRVAVTVPGQKSPVVYWYMLYTVENSTEREVDFYPDFTLVTDTMRIVKNEVQVSPEAFQAIQRRSGNPALLPPEKVLGKLLRGQDRARSSVAIWKDFEPQAKGFTVFVAGLSGEVSFVKNPAYDSKKPEDAGNRRAFILRKTLELPYKFPGAESMRTYVVPERQTERQKWIMR